MTSATWPAGVRRLAEKYMQNPIQVCIGSLDLAAVHTVEQIIEIIDEDRKFDKVNFKKDFIVSSVIKYSLLFGSIEDYRIRAQHAALWQGNYILWQEGARRRLEQRDQPARRGCSMHSRWPRTGLSLIIADLFSTSISWVIIQLGLCRAIASKRWQI